MQQNSVPSFKLGLLEGEMSTIDGVKIGISGSLKEHCIRVEN